MHGHAEFLSDTNVTDWRQSNTFAGQGAQTCEPGQPQHGLQPTIASTSTSIIISGSTKLPIPSIAVVGGKSPKNS